MIRLMMIDSTMYASRKRLKVTSVEDGEAKLTPLECLPLF